MAQSYAWLRETGGHGETDAFAASEAFVDRGYDAVVALTRSGTTTEVLELVERLRGRVRTVGVIGDPTSPLVDLVDDAVTLPFADEQSVVQTRFATTALALFRASLGEDLDRAVADAAPRDRRRPRPRARRRRAVHVPRPRLDGRPRPRGGAQDARGVAVVDRVVPRDGVPSRPDLDRRAGPGHVALRRTARRASREDVAATGARFEAGTLDPMAELVRAQRVALAARLARGLDPDAPRNLTRSVILES